MYRNMIDVLLTVLILCENFRYSLPESPNSEGNELQFSKRDEEVNCVSYDNNQFYFMSVSGPYADSVAVCKYNGMELASQQDLRNIPPASIPTNETLWISKTNSASDCVSYHPDLNVVNTTKCGESFKFFCKKVDSNCTEPIRPFVCQNRNGKTYYFMLVKNTYAQSEKFCFDRQRALSTVTNDIIEMLKIYKKHDVLWSHKSAATSNCEVYSQTIRLHTSDCQNKFQFICHLSEETSKQTDCSDITNPHQNGGWGLWPDWTACTVSCGYGQRTKTRQCNNPPPGLFGHPCPGSNTKFGQCNEFPCIVNGGFSLWSPWTNCKCGGTRRRFRNCDSPLPAIGGEDCVGEKEEAVSCETCPSPADLRMEYQKIVIQENDHLPEQPTITCHDDSSSSPHRLVLRQLCSEKSILEKNCEVNEVNCTAHFTVCGLFHGAIECAAMDATNRIVRLARVSVKFIFMGFFQLEFRNALHTLLDDSEFLVGSFIGCYLREEFFFSDIINEVTIEQYCYPNLVASHSITCAHSFYCETTVKFCHQHSNPVIQCSTTARGEQYKLLHFKKSLKHSIRISIIQNCQPVGATCVTPFDCCDGSVCIAISGEKHCVAEERIPFKVRVNP